MSAAPTLASGYPGIQQDPSSKVYFFEGQKTPDEEFILKGKGVELFNFSSRAISTQGKEAVTSCSSFRLQKNVWTMDRTATEARLMGDPYTESGISSCCHTHAHRGHLHSLPFSTASVERFTATAADPAGPRLSTLPHFWCR